ncbi:SH3 domain-containing protein, partial [Amphibacillus cookii]|uniref:SH3 domain-containing protein n=1 Tax=Amphibacillus cookii TaxID=767787 RepID=UPI001957EBFA
LSSRDKTHVYSQPSTSSSALRSYSPGRLLQYRTLSANWYEAIVIINGQQQTGYIHKDHVETFDRSNQQSLQGLSSRDKTHVYSQPSTSSSALRSYSPGRLLQYKTLSANWYEAIVIINGQQQTGYIHKDHVETFDRSNQQSLQGLSLRDKTHVYSQPSTSSSALRSYSPGRLLQYRTLSANWYEAIVIINGQQQTGYIHKDHVETLDLSNQQSLEGIALKQTHVYSAPSKNSNVLRSYQSGHVLMYKTYSNEWYQALVIIDGQRRTGYIHKNDVETISDTQESLTGYADKSTTNVYSRASRDSSTLRSYSRGQSLQFKTFSSEWYQAIVIINGQQRTGYIHKNDVRFDPITNIHYTNYNYTFSSMIDIQMTRSPQANGTGTIDAGRNLVEYYANPSNFREGENGFYQFLVLSSPAGLNASEVNRSILNSSTGTLAGTAGAFIEAANRFNINEAYLIAHALHETGNGSSALAQGVTVNGRKVYNMYGTAAYDGSAVSSGAQYAYNKGWFTPEAAIIGGAEFVARNYISVGQDTLYKMRWNPGNPGHHQYATHVAWAQIPTNRIANIYNSLDNYLLKFDVPQFQNQPGYSGPNPPPNVIEFTDFPSGSVGITTGTGVRFRSVPSTASNSTIITTIADRNTRLELLGTNNKGWYKAIYNGTEGWISEQYVNALNVLQITATSLNVRSGPSTSNTIVGNLNNGNVVRGVLDSNDNLVTSNGWYQIHFENSQAWISAGSNHQYLSIR